MIDAAQIANRYIAVWNETDLARRRALLAEGRAEDATYIDPVMYYAARHGRHVRLAFSGLLVLFRSCQARIKSKSCEVLMTLHRASQSAISIQTARTR